MTTTPHSGSPPRARLTFRVGIVGHRPNRLPTHEVGREAIRARLAQVLEAAKAAVTAFQATHPDAACYLPHPPQLRAISAMAEGADRDFVEEALRLGYALCSPLPFAQEEYEKDFEGPDSLESGSVERFRGLLDQAATGPGLTQFELDGSRRDVAAAYGAAGRVVLNQSDLLVVVWDGADAQGDGGTVSTLREAIDFHVPVLWIDARAPFGCRLLHDVADLRGLEDGSLGVAPGPALDSDTDRGRLAETIAQIVTAEFVRPEEAPSEEHHQKTRDRVADYFAEHKPKANLGFIWKSFRDLIGSGKLTLPKLRVGDFVAQIHKAWPVADPDDDTGGPASVAHWVNARLRVHYAWSDRLADFYADMHRSAFIIASVFASAAVFMALLPMAIGIEHGGDDWEVPSIVAEFAILGMMVFLLNIRRDWHERWLEYRVLAELIRQLRLLIPMGGSRPLPRSPPHLATYGDPVRSWMYWQMRAIARAAGIPTARATIAYRLECLDYLADVTAGPEAGQLGFHRATYERSEKIHDRLHRAALFLFWISIVGIVVHLALILPIAPQGEAKRTIEAINRGSSGWLILISAVAPALGAALANINNQGEFARLAKRSRAMADVFGRFEAEITQLRDRATGDEQGAPLAQVTSLASQVAERMIEENLDWRVVVLDLPHVAG